MNLSEKEIREMLQQNLEMDRLIAERPEDKPLLESVIELITEVLLSQEKTIWIARKTQETAFVKERLLSLRAAHICYVIDCLAVKEQNVGNIRQYLLTSLYNAPVTMAAYYKVKEGKKKEVPSPKKKNGFVNYRQSEYDFDELERLERELRDKW